METTGDREPGSIWLRGWQFLRGPRFIDLPIRALALVMGLTVLLPGSFELDEPLYAGLLVVAYVLIIMTPFVVLPVILLSTVLSFVFLWQYPDLENMFPEALILAAAVLLSYCRWRGFVFTTACLLAYLAGSTWMDTIDAGLPGVIDLGYGWLTSSLLGLAAGLVERRIQREIVRRETAAREHQQTMESMRARFTSDMHDTISNSLATEAAIINALARGTHDHNTDRQLAELTLVNAEASKRLRQLVARLSRGSFENARTRLGVEAQQLAAAIEKGCTAGGVRLSTSVGALPTHASRVVAQHFAAIMLELATNVIRYSTPGTASSLEVSIERRSADEAVLSFVSVNEAAAAPTQPPRSLGLRSRALGGACTVDTDLEGRVVVEVIHPLRFVTSGDDEVEAVCVHDEFGQENSAQAHPPIDAMTSELPGHRTVARTSTDARSGSE